jgi:hypothetical protein
MNSVGDLGANLNMRLPDFLIIGAMKCGTTTLFRDLDQHSEIFLPDEKEPDDLTSDRVLSESGKKNYAKLFSGALESQRCGEASTASTKHPEIEGVARRAFTVLGPNLKLIYIVRDPLERSVSQFKFGARRGDYPADMKRALEIEPGLVNTSRYLSQTEEWLKYFSPENLHVVIFEEYLKHRKRELDRLCEFLEVPEIELPNLHHSNPTDSSFAYPTLMRILVRSRLYRRTIKPIFSQQLRDTAKKLFGKKSAVLELVNVGTATEVIASQIHDETLEFMQRHSVAPEQWPTTKLLFDTLPREFDQTAEQPQPRC